MHKKLYTVVALFIASGCVASEPSASIGTAIKGGDEIQVLKNECGYELPSSFLGDIKKIQIRELTTGEFRKAIEFHIDLKFERRTIPFLLTFVCGHHPNSLGLQWPIENQNDPEALTAYSNKALHPQDLIQAPYSGGRYGPEVSERKFSGKNWAGLIAHANFLFGDGQSSPIADTFIVCPNRPDRTCFSMDMVDQNNDTPHLTKKEQSSLRRAMSDIRLVEMPQHTK